MVFKNGLSGIGECALKLLNFYYMTDYSTVSYSRGKGIITLFNLVVAQLFSIIQISVLLLCQQCRNGVHTFRNR